MLLALRLWPLCAQVDITDKSSSFCSSSALDAMFVSTNFEEEDSMSKKEQEENDDNALMRFEWLEIIIRAAIAKYIQEEKATQDVGRMLPPAAAALPCLVRALIIEQDG